MGVTRLTSANNALPGSVGIPARITPPRTDIRQELCNTKIVPFGNCVRQGKYGDTSCMVMMGTEASGSTNRTTPFLSASFCWPRLWVMCQLLLPSARHYRRLVALSGMIQQRPDLHPLIQSARRLCSTSASHFGFIGLALQALRLHDWAWTEEWTIVRNGTA